MACALRASAILSINGVFGMAAYSVSKRLRELGIRMALGAQRRDGAGASNQVAGVWFRGRIAAWNPGESCVGLRRVSGNSARSAGIGWCCSGHGVAGYVDSSATRVVD